MDIYSAFLNDCVDRKQSREHSLLLESLLSIARPKFTSMQEKEGKVGWKQEQVKDGWGDNAEQAVQ